MVRCPCKQHVHTHMNMQAKGHSNIPDKADVAGLGEIVCSLHGNTLNSLTHPYAQLMGLQDIADAQSAQRLVDYSPLPRAPQKAVPLPYRGLTCDLCSDKLNMAWQLWKAPATILPRAVVNPQSFPRSSEQSQSRTSLRCAVTPASNGE